MEQENIVDLLMRRDGLSRDEVLSNLEDSYSALNASSDGHCIEEMLREDFGLEPDYFFDILHLAEENNW